MKRFPAQIAATFLLVAFFLPTNFAQSIQDDTAIRNILRERVEVKKKGVGIVVGVLNDKGSKSVGFGRMKAGEANPVTADSLFEIGSITKVFTTILLADMVEKGEVKLDDPISKYLPKTVKTPTFNGKEITLVDLATHTSSLPRMPSNFRPKDQRNPFADYTVEQLYKFLSDVKLTREIGSKYDYSNVGMGLLGHILALRAKTDYETLVVKRICEPLKMKDTRITLSAEQQTRLATGHSADLKPVANWDIPTLAGAGALRSTVNDMLLFAAANLGLIKTKLLPVLQKSHQILRKTDSPELEVALGWHVRKKFGAEIIWHNGGTGGYRTFFGFDPNKRAAVVVLNNSGVGQDDIGYHILESQFPLQTFAPPVERKEIKVAADVLEQYTGVYQLAPNVTLTVTREGDRLFAQVTDQPRVELYAESEVKFFLKVVEAQITFVKDDSGKVTQLTLHQGGNMTAKKVK